MKSEDITVQQLFKDPRQFMVPFYQRAYVWNLVDQWAQLWEDIESKANDRLFGISTPHFLGAVVLDPQPRTGLIGIETLHIIDGQQRLTTLQFILKSVLIQLKEPDLKPLLAVVNGLLFNLNEETMINPDIERFKLWPTFRDREYYRSALGVEDRNELRTNFPDSFTQRETLRKIGIIHPPALEAIWFFSEQFGNWISEGEENEIYERGEALITAILKDLKVVSIILEREDDAQVIFETLNGRGAQLHATDLIRNFIFMRADKENVNSEFLYDEYWSKFEEYYWNSNQTRGRMQKPRIEWFIHCYLQTELCEEIELGRLYFEYRRYVLDGDEPKSAELQLETLTNYSEIYRELLDGTEGSPVAEFGRRIAPYEVTTLHPLALLIATSTISEEAKDEMFKLMVSYIVRRAICGLTTKNYNNVFLSILRHLSDNESSPQSLRKALSSFEGTASRWPRNPEFRRACETAYLYPGTLDARKMRAVLGELETNLQATLNTENKFDVNTERLDIDHILPISWYKHWPLRNGEKVRKYELNTIDWKLSVGNILDEREHEIQSRENAIGVLGNLTLLDLSVNREAQNKSFEKKKKLLLNNTNLRLNIPLLGLKSWDENTIECRSKQLCDIALRIWSGIE